MRPDARRLVVAALTILAAGCGGRQEILSAADGWVRAMPPGAGATAAYLTLHNGTPDNFRIERISAGGFTDAALHETTMVDGVMRMRPTAPLQLAPDQSLSLTPGGTHLMLLGAANRLSAGDRVEITFWRDGAAALTVTLPVAAENPYVSP